MKSAKPAPDVTDRFWSKVKIGHGTRGENNNDRHKKGRSAKGERHGGVKLTQEIVDSIRAEYSGIRGQQRALAAKYKVSQALIGYIVNNKIWRN